MSLPCPTCGATIDLPPGFDRPKVRCTGCGYYAPVPEKLRNQPPARDDIDLSDDTPPAPKPKKPVRKPAPPPLDPSRQPLRPGVARPVNARPPADDVIPLADDDPPPGPALLSGTQHDDDGPYTVPGDGTKKCPECRKELPLDAVFCVKCGLDFDTDRFVKRREFQAVNKVWEARWPLVLRLQVFAGLVVFNVMMSGVLLLFGWQVIPTMVVLAFQLAVQGVAVGSFETVWAKRTSKGQMTVHRQWRVAFIPQGRERVEWEQHQGVGLISVGGVGLTEWFAFLYLFVCTGVCPAILFFWFVMHPSRFAVGLCDNYGAVHDRFFHTTDRDAAEEVAKTISDCGGLAYHPVL